MNQDKDEIRSEYDFSHGERGKYAERYKKGANVVVLEPDLARIFTDSEKANQALREYLKLKAQ